jgi:hypothetical protein
MHQRLAERARLGSVGQSARKRMVEGAAKNSVPASIARTVPFPRFAVEDPTAYCRLPTAHSPFTLPVTRRLHREWRSIDQAGFEQPMMAWQA